MTARFPIWQLLVALAAAAPAFAAQPPLLAPGHGAAIAEELSGESAKRTVETFSLQHRMRGSRGFRAAAEHVAAELRRYGLSAVEIVEIPADGTTLLRHPALAPAVGRRVRGALGAGGARRTVAAGRALGELGCGAAPPGAGQRERATSSPSSSTSALAPTRRTTPAAMCAARSCSPPRKPRRSCRSPSIATAPPAS